jgi:hypothetical protein
MFTSLHDFAAELDSQLEPFHPVCEINATHATSLLSSLPIISTFSPIVISLTLWSAFPLLKISESSTKTWKINPLLAILEPIKSDTEIAWNDH